MFYDDSLINDCLPCPLLIPWTGDGVDEQFLLVVLVVVETSGSFMVRVRGAGVASRGSTSVSTIPP